LIGDEEAPADGPEATAGMTLSLLDVLLRPIEFFRGSGGLMSAVWNAPSEPVSALQVQDTILMKWKCQVELCSDSIFKKTMRYYADFGQQFKRLNTVYISDSLMNVSLIFLLFKTCKMADDSPSQITHHSSLYCLPFICL
jgi:hypothetical protein